MSIPNPTANSNFRISATASTAGGEARSNTALYASQMPAISQARRTQNAAKPGFTNATPSHQ